MQDNCNDKLTHSTKHRQKVSRESRLEIHFLNYRNEVANQVNQKNCKQRTKDSNSLRATNPDKKKVESNLAKCSPHDIAENKKSQQL